MIYIWFITGENWVVWPAMACNYLCLIQHRRELSSLTRGSQWFSIWFIFDSLQEKIDYFDSVYLKKRLMNEPDPIDAGLQDFYTKIVIKWVIQFCIAAEFCLHHWSNRHRQQTHIHHIHTHTHKHMHTWALVHTHTHTHTHTVDWGKNNNDMIFWWLFLLLFNFLGLV